MQWRQLDIATRDVSLATGESLHTLASFQGHDGETDIIKAHLALDGGDVVLLAEFEDASGKRQLGRTTQWPAQILSLIGATIEFEFLLRADDGKNVDDSTGAHEKPAPTTETTPESEASGGSGDPAAPAGAEGADHLSNGSQPETTGSEGPGATEESGSNPSSPAPTPDDDTPPAAA